ncbi:MAG: helix-turn-helix transcriptional regulator [Fusobacterium sp.]|nr:helix-turn-helix transcriptional regulator [Fusobacterium sp.]
MKTLNDLLNERLKDENFKKEWEAFQPELQLMQQLIKERSNQNISQKELADRMGTKQANISRIENGNANPSLDFLKRLAKALGKKLEIKFVD